MSGSSANESAAELQYEPLILVTRGDELPKKNYQRKLHPTYETSIRIKNGGQQTRTSPHYVVKFYDQYYELYNKLRAMDIGQGLPIDIDAPFPVKYPKSYLGIALSEQQLQHRCYLLNKWMSAIFHNYHTFPARAQLCISEFLSLNDEDSEQEQNKELILSLLRRKTRDATAESIVNNTSTGASAGASSSTMVGNPAAATGSNSNSSSNGPAAAAGGGGAGGPVGGPVGVPVGGPVVLTSAALSEHTQQSSLPSGQQEGTRAHDGGAADPTMDIYARENIVNQYLGVHVEKGNVLVRKKDDQKLHHSYETKLRMLELSEVDYSTALAEATVTGKGNSSAVVRSREQIDVEVYDAQRALPSISVCYAFDAYRELKNDLERVHVYASDNPTGSSADRHAGFKVIVIDAPFPKTLAKSTVGVSLSETEVHERAALLNNWLGMLLQNFTVLPRDGKELITDFLGMPSVYHEQGRTAIQYVIAHSLLRGSYTPPLLPVPQQQQTSSTADNRPRSGLMSVLGFGKRSSNSASGNDTSKNNNNNARPPPPAAAAGASTTNSTPAAPTAEISGSSKIIQSSSSGGGGGGGGGAVDVTGDTTQNNSNSNNNNNNNNNGGGGGGGGGYAYSRIASDQFSMMSGNEETGSDAGLADTAAEITVGSYLGVSVIRAKPVAKKVGEQRVHPAYEILLRILPLDETILPEAEKRRIDEEEYTNLVEQGPVRRTYPFDNFRNLKAELESYRVYSLDRKAEVDSMLHRNPDDAVVLIDARFPRTYKRQSLGFKLTEPQLNQRAVLLNNWFGAVLQSFNHLPFLAKQMVVQFLSMPEHMQDQQDLFEMGYEGRGINPDKVPRDEIIMTMLKLTYTPTYKKSAEGEEGGDERRKRRAVAPGEGGCLPGCVVM